MDYLDFDLEITPSRGRTYTVAVLRSPVGEPRSTLKLPFDRRGLELRMLALENTLLRSGATHTRRVTSAEEAPVQAFGEALFTSLLNGEVLSCYDQSRREAREQRRGLRVKLRIQAPELVGLPWEFLYDPREDEFVCLSRRTPIVRYLESRQSQVPLAVRPPLRILGLVSSPEGLPKLDIATEQRRVEDALSDLRAAHMVELVWLGGQTWTDLQNAMWQGPWHVFHFIGHGGFDPERDEGVLAIADETGGKRLLSATELGRLLGDQDELRLAVLNACEGARGGREDIFSSTAATLVRRGVPTVVAMQYEISDAAAIQFGNRFYAAIAHGMAVDAALAEARIGMSVATRESAEWGTPVLYTNAPEVRVFELSDPPAPAPPPRSAAADDAIRSRQEARWTEALSYFWTERWDQAVALLSEIVAEQPDYRDAAAKLAEARGHAQVASLYASGKEAYDNGEWAAAAGSLEKVADLQPDFADAAVLLEEARRQVRITALYEEARRLHAAGAWQATLNVLDRIRLVHPEFEDVADLQASAREALAAEEHKQRLHALVAKAVREMDAGAWRDAVTVLEEVASLQPGFGDADALLARARRELARTEPPPEPSLIVDEPARADAQTQLGADDAPVSVEVSPPAPTQRERVARNASPSAPSATERSARAATREPEHWPRVSVLAIGLGWTFAWTVGLGAAFVLLTWEEHNLDEPNWRSVVGIGSAIAAFIGGLIAALARHQSQPSFGSDRVLLTALAWTVPGFIGGLIGGAEQPSESAALGFGLFAIAGGAAAAWIEDPRTPFSVLAASAAAWLVATAVGLALAVMIVPQATAALGEESVYLPNVIAVVIGAAAFGVLGGWASQWARRLDRGSVSLER